MLDPVQILRKRCQGRQQKDVAAELGISPQYLCDVLAERKDAGEAILDPLGLERVVTYRRKKASQ